MSAAAATGELLNQPTTTPTAPVLGSTYLQGHRAVTALTVVTSARAVNYLNALLSRLSRWHTEPSVIELAHRVKTEIPTA